MKIKGFIENSVYDVQNLIEKERKKYVFEDGTQLFASISISLLPLLCKVFEAIALDQVSCFLSFNKILNENQLVSEGTTQQIHVFLNDKVALTIVH